MYILDYLMTQLKLHRLNENMTMLIFMNSLRIFWRNLLSCLMTLIRKSTFVKSTIIWFKKSRSLANFIFSFNDYLFIWVIWFDLIWIHTLLWHQFKFNSWEKLCYVYWMNKTLWKRKSLIDYMMTSRHWNNKIDTMLSVMNL